ncbi:MAG TPA: hypothetical protein VN442_04775 [Bryobacteraceae bacterium]|nr:hypothetical protein [Bryobacteraceae bacterium]
MKRALAIILLALPAMAAVDGTVVNRTTGKPATGAVVTLYQMGQGGMSPLETMRADGEGRFAATKDAEGPKLLQVIFDGVVYSQMLTPGTPTTGVTVDVYNTSKQPGEAKIAQHMVLLEPSDGQLAVSEAYVFNNSGKTTYNNPADGTLRFWMPDEAKGIVKVNATAPGGMPVERTAVKAAEANVYKVDFPIKPGETRIDVRYLVPFASDGTYKAKVLHNGSTRLVTPGGVTLAGDNIASLGPEPQTGANIYDLKGRAIKVTVQGNGSLRAAEPEVENAGPEIQRIMPKIWDNAIPILGLAFGILALGFVLLYRAQPGA